MFLLMRATRVAMILGYSKDGVRAGIFWRHLVRGTVLFRRGASMLWCDGFTACRSMVGELID